MNVKVADVMAKRVVTAQPHHAVEHVQALMKRNRIHAVPVVGPDNEALGIVTTADLAQGVNPGTPVKYVMSDTVRQVPAYNDASVAARVMRRNKIHHVVITHEKRVVGIVSSLDLLKLVEGQRFVAKDAPPASKSNRKAKQGRFSRKDGWS